MEHAVNPSAFVREAANAAIDWDERLAYAVETVRELSRHTDPQAMVRHYGQRVRKTVPYDAVISLSRRGLDQPQYRITRSSRWPEPVNPWKEKDKLPLLTGGLLAELIWSDEPRIIDELVFAPSDPAADYFEGHRSLAALPLYDGGSSLNMVVLLRNQRDAFVRDEFPNMLVTSNLFGRATHNLVLSSELRTAYELVDAELRVIADIQRSLLPQELPDIPTMQIAAHYQTARRAGGDYYDFFSLPDGRWGMLIADVSGHGTPAAVVMAITHSLAHGFCEQRCGASPMLEHLNRSLARRYTGDRGTFVTALYAVYDPAKRTLTYAAAGHPPPRVERCADGSIFSLDAVGGLPLGIEEAQRYPEHTQTLQPGDQIIFYTDGITEAMNPAGEFFGTERLDDVIRLCTLHADQIIHSLLEAVEEFTAGQPPEDDRTVLVAKIK